MAQAFDIDRPYLSRMRELEARFVKAPPLYGIGTRVACRCGSLGCTKDYVVEIVFGDFRALRHMEKLWHGFRPRPEHEHDYWYGLISTIHRDYVAESALALAPESP